MPNHCTNQLTVIGPEVELSRFMSAVVTKQEPKQVTDSDENDDPYTRYEAETIEIFENLYPCPRELRDTTSGFFPDKDKMETLRAQQEQNTEKYGFKDWYDWCVAKWGTKWGDYDTTLTDGPSYIKSDGTGRIARVTYQYTTAWGPGLNGIATISGMFPSLWFVNSYEEGGMGFFGCFTASNGDVLIDEEGNYPDPEPTDGGDGDEAWESVYEQVREAMDKMTDRQIERLPV